MKHIDLFSGIGGFAYAIDQVWENVKHIFCEIDPFCQQVLKKHWQGSVIYGDIREVIADAESEGLQGNKLINPHSKGPRSSGSVTKRDAFQVDILTGGFPCQPFSCAGKRKGTDDDRHLWPKMFRVIQLTKPTWVVAENVRGLLTIEQGVVFEQVCLDLEGEGYEVQAFVIPAVAVNAPHRRDRVWFVANRRCERPLEQEQQTTRGKQCDSDVTDTGEQPNNGCGVVGIEEASGVRRDKHANGSWDQNWLEVATELCGVDDGLPAKLDGFELTKSKHRVERLKSLGNSIVPQVAKKIFEAIKIAEVLG